MGTRLLTHLPRNNYSKLLYALLTSRRIRRVYRRLRNLRRYASFFLAREKSNWKKTTLELHIGIPTLPSAKLRSREVALEERTWFLREAKETCRIMSHFAGVRNLLRPLIASYNKRIEVLNYCLTICVRV